MGSNKGRLTLSAHDLGHMLGAGHGHTLGHVHALLPGLVVARGVLVQVEQGEVQRELQSSLVVQGVDPLAAAAAAIPLQLGEQGARHLGKKEGGLLLFSRQLSWISDTGQRRERRVGIEEGEKRRLWKEKPLVQKKKREISALSLSGPGSKKGKKGKKQCKSELPVLSPQNTYSEGTGGCCGAGGGTNSSESAPPCAQLFSCFLSEFLLQTHSSSGTKLEGGDMLA